MRTLWQSESESNRKARLSVTNSIISWKLSRGLKEKDFSNLENNRTASTIRLSYNYILVSYEGKTMLVPVTYTLNDLILKKKIFCQKQTHIAIGSWHALAILIIWWLNYSSYVTLLWNADVLPSLLVEGKVCLCVFFPPFLSLPEGKEGRKESEGAHVPHPLNCVIGWRPTSAAGDGNSPGGPWIIQSWLYCSFSGFSDENIKKFWTLEDKKTRKSHFYLKKKIFIHNLTAHWVKLITFVKHFIFW